MTATATYGITGDPYLDGVLSGLKWGVNNLTFSFPANGSLYGATYASGENLKAFEAFTAQQAAAVRDILKMYSTVANLSFTELTESSTVHAELRYAESDSTNTAWAYYPSTSTVGGDAWFNNSKNYYDTPARGNYAWLTMIHETGHALGLKHPHEARGAFGALPTDHDSLEYSVMSYRSYVGASTTTGYTNGSGSYPQTLMMQDIAAIQKLYGANYATNAGDTVYSWSATTGTMSINGTAQAAPSSNKIFMTLWDGGGSDTYSFANYASGVTVDLNPGAWTTASAAQLASLGSGKVAVGNVANALLYAGNVASLIENAVGGAGADKLYGNAGANKLTGGAGNDVLDGRGGTDTAAFSGNSGNYSWLHNSDDSWTVKDLRTGSPDGTDTLKSIEYLQFADAFIQLGSSTSQTVITPPPPVVNSKPLGHADSYTTNKNTNLTVTSSNGVLKNDTDANGDHLSASLVSGPSKGKLAFKSDGSFTYTPVKNFVGSVTFKYTASDGVSKSDVITATISVGAAAGTKGRGSDAGVDHEHMEDDQIPGQATGHDAPGWQMSDLVNFRLQAGQLAATISHADMLAHLNSVLGELGQLTAWSTSPQHLPAGDIDITGLPDFMKVYSSEFVLF
jgi:serralysin